MLTLRVHRGWVVPSALLGCALLVGAQQAVQPLAGAPLPGLTPAELARFEAGKAAFEHSPTIAEGLGPIMNNAGGYSGGCIHCHGFPATGGGSGIQVQRFGQTGSGSTPFDPLIALGGPVLQTLTIDQLACYETVPPQANVTTQRGAGQCFGFGLVEALLDADLLVREALPPAGVSGRANLATPIEAPLSQPIVGRFGWKSQVPTLLNFSADALVNEFGITNRYFPLDLVANGAPSANAPCDNVADPEDGPDAQGFHRIDRMSDFMRFLGPPPQTPKSGMAGESLFNAVGCATCHVSTPYTTAPDAPEVGLRNRSFKPYSDFLVHDMGTLSDGFPEGMATGSEFRTTPLWGVRFRAPYGLLHDNSARNGNSPEDNLHLAILAHAGEAAAAVAAYSALSAADRLKLQKFLMSLGQFEFNFDDGAQQRITEVDWLFMRLQVTGPGTFFDADDPRAVGDFDQDGDIDLHDIAGLQRAFTGI